MNNQGSEALFQASSTCKPRLVRMLVEGGTSVNVRNDRLETALMLSCQSETDIEEKRRVVTYLLGQKAKVNLQDIDGRTALIHAALSNSGKEVIKALLDAKANPWVQDESKNTVFDYVINAGDLETTRLLINACRENRIADERENGQMENLEECLANIQDLRKFSWPLMGPRLRRNHTHVYAAQKEEPSISSNNLLGCDLVGDDVSKSPQPERRRKRSVCHFDPLDIQEILNCKEEPETNTSSKEHVDEGKSESRKTSVRSLSEEERFSFQISDSENAPSDPSSGLEKLLKLRDSFCSSLDSNEFPCTANDSADDTARSPSGDLQVCEETNSVLVTTGILNPNEQENKEIKNDNVSSDSNNCKTDENISKETPKEYERLFTFRISAVSVSKDESYKPDSEATTAAQRQTMINSSTDICKTDLENIESRSNPYTSLVTSHQSSPVVSPLSSPRVTRRQTHASGTLKQSMSPRASPVFIPNEQNRRETSIVRRYTLSAMDMGKLRNTGVAKTFLAPPVHSTSQVESDKRRGSAIFESTTKESPDGNTNPPGLRKSKSDMTDWKSMAREQFNDHAKLEGSEIVQFQLPSISSAKKGRRSPKEFVYPMSSAGESKQPNVEARIELTTLPCRNNVEKQRFSVQSGQELLFDDKKCSPSPTRTSLPSSPKDLPITTPSSSSDKSDIVAIATVMDTSSRSPDKTPGDVLPDLLLNCPQEGQLQVSKQGGASSTNFNSWALKDTIITSNSNPAEERNATGPAHSQQRTSSRLRPGTLLPPLLITNRRSPTHEMEDGYFSCSPSPADVESPRRKLSNEQLRYSFKPISPRSPILTPKAFSLQSGKPPTYR